MLTLTENASTVVKQINDQIGGEGAGLRISQDASEAPSLAVESMPAPAPGDEVVELDGARLFLQEEASRFLDDKVLDAQVDTDGGVEFSLGVQPTG